MLIKKKWMCVEGCTFVSVSTPESDTSCHSSQPLLCSNNSIKGEATPWNNLFILLLFLLFFVDY